MELQKRSRRFHDGTPKAERSPTDSNLILPANPPLSFAEEHADTNLSDFLGSGYENVWDEMCGEIDKARDEALLAGKNIFQIESKLLRKALERNKLYGMVLQSSFPLHFKADEDRWPLGWWFTYADIRERLNNPKDKTFHRMIAILNYLWRNRPRGNIAMEECGELAIRLGVGRYRKQGVERPFAFIKDLDFQDMENKVSCSRMSIHHVMQEMAEGKILIRFRRDGSHGQIKYAIGYWSPFMGGKWKVIPFLQNTDEHIAVLKKIGKVRIN